MSRKHIDKKFYKCLMLKVIPIGSVTESLQGYKLAQCNAGDIIVPIALGRLKRLFPLLAWW